MLMHQAKSHTMFKDVTGAPITEIENDAERTIVLLNFTSGIDYNQHLEEECRSEGLDEEECLKRGFDPDELEETMDDAQELLSKFGSVKRLYLTHLLGITQEDASDTPSLCSTFTTSSSVLLALSALDGILLGGQVIRIKMLKQIIGGNPITINHDTTQPIVPLVSGGTLKGDSQDIDFPAAEKKDSVQFAVGGVKLVMENLVSREDIQEREELDEVLDDIRYLCESYGAIFSWKEMHMAVHLHTPASISSSILAQKAVANASGVLKSVWNGDRRIEFPSDPTPLTLMWYSDVTTAYSACQRCSGKVVEGRQLSFAFYDFNAYESSLFGPSYCIPFPPNASIINKPDRLNSPGDIIGIQLRGMTWNFRDQFSVDSVMSDIDKLLSIGCSSQEHAMARALLYCCNFYRGDVNDFVPGNNEKASTGHVVYNKLLFVGLSFYESIRLQSHINRIFVSCLSLDVAFNHLILPDNGSTLLFQADIISTFDIRTDSTHCDSDTISGDDVNSFYRIPDNRSDHDDHSHYQSSRVLPLPSLVSCPQIISAADEGCVVAVQGYITDQDILGDAGDSPSLFPEEIKAMKIDFLKLLRLYKNPAILNSNFYCKRVSFIPSTELTKVNPLSPVSHTLHEPSNLVDDKYDVAISFKRVSEAVEVMLTLDGVVLGGQKVKCLLSESRCSSENVIFSFTPGKQRASEIDEAAATPVVSKLPVRVVPVSNEIPLASEDINGVIKELLKKLSTFQQRAKENNPLSAKKGERLVMGMRQVCEEYYIPLSPNV
jgi:xanthosine utilization system XapX-like protein